MALTRLPKEVSSLESKKCKAIRKHIVFKKTKNDKSMTEINCNKEMRYIFTIAGTVKSINALALDHFYDPIQQLAIPSKAVAKYFIVFQCNEWWDEKHCCYNFNFSCDSNWNVKFGFFSNNNIADEKQIKEFIFNIYETVNDMGMNKNYNTDCFSFESKIQNEVKNKIN